MGTELGLSSGDLCGGEGGKKRVEPDDGVEVDSRAHMRPPGPEEQCQRWEGGGGAAGHVGQELRARRACQREIRRRLQRWWG